VGRPASIFHTFVDFVGGVELSKRVFLVGVHVGADEFVSILLRCVLFLVAIVGWFLPV